MEMLTTPEGRRIACHLTPGAGPGLVFLGGFRSDMTGTKAVYLEDWARAAGRGYLRFDYSGHGASSGRFEDLCIGDWLADSIAALDLTAGPQVLVGSSMGGWLALLLARARPERVAGLVLIAPAPEFPASMWAGMSAAQRAEVTGQGVTLLPSEYGDPYPITRRLIEEARAHGVYDRPCPAPWPVRIVQGMADAAVPVDWALRLAGHIDSPDLRLVLLKGEDHRVSSVQGLAAIRTALAEVLGAAG
jgi:pimeloyl-ACP methyl ester carboxylesterase